MKSVVRQVINVHEFARGVGVTYWTAIRWLGKGIVPGAVKKTVNKMHYWEIPISALKMDRPKLGRPKGDRNGK